MYSVRKLYVCGGNRRERHNDYPPKKRGIKKSSAIVIPAGSFFITIHIPKNSQIEAEGWLPATKRKEIKFEAEKLAEEDAISRAKGQHQL